MASKAKKVQDEKVRRARWSIGVFLNDAWKLVTVYVRAADGTPMPNEAGRVGDRKILFHQTYVGIKYSEARVALLNDASRAGVREEGGDDKPKASSKSKPAPKAAAKKAPAKRGRKK